VQPVAFVEDQVSVEFPPLVIVCGLAEIVTVGAGGGVTVTVTDCAALPPAPVHVSVKVPVLVKIPVVCVPLVALTPVHAPEAVQVAASVDDHVSVELAPLAMICGFAEIVTVGTGATVTVADCEALPPAPVQLREKVLVLVSAPADCVPLVALAPDQAPDAVQLSALVADQVSVGLAPLAMVCGLTVMVTVGAGGVTVTVADWAALPPLPVQVNVKVPVPVNDPVDCDPLVVLAPVHAPEAVQLVASVEDQVSVALAPFAMVCGLAVIVTVGAGAVTVTVADCASVPPAPVQLSEKVLVAVNAPVDCVPLVASAPVHAPEAVQVSALVDDQVSVELVPFATVCGLAVIVSVGAGGVTVTVADWERLPPAPVQLSVKVPVVVRAPVDCVPLVALTPVHAPEAVQVSTLVDDQVSVELAPFAMVCGLAVMVTAGGAGVTVTVADCEVLPPAPVQLREKVLVLASTPVDCAPLVALAPDHAPDAVQPVASVDDQVRVALAPLAMLCGLAVIVAVGAGGVTVTVADCETLPPPPAQLSVKVLLLVNAPVDCEPLVAVAPAQAPEAVQVSALVDDQVSVELAPLAIVCGLAAIVTVGGVGGGEALTVTVADCEALPPAPVQMSEKVLVLAKAPVDWLPLVVLVPVHAPEAVQLVASVEDHVSVAPVPLAMFWGFAEIVTVGAGAGGVTVTVVDCKALPPAPVQLNVKLLVPVRAPVDCVPLVVVAPVHAPEAVQVSALVDDQVSVELAPLAIVWGFAVIVTVGAGGVTVTVADCAVLPPLPVQLNVKVLVLANAPVDCVPPVALAPVHAPEAVQLVALVDDQVSVEAVPLATVCGLAVIVTAGGAAFTVTVAAWERLPPPPVHVSEKLLVLVNGPVDCVPLVALAPVQAPEAVQPVALVEDQVSEALAPFAMVWGLAEMVTVGGGGVTVTVADWERLPPLPVQLSEKVLVFVNGPVDSVPLTALAPAHAPEAVQPVALVDDQVSVALAPLATVCGLAPIATVGGGGVTVTSADCEALPPTPVQVSEKALVPVRMPVDCEPLVPLTPAQAPEAVQLLALVDDHVNVELAPLGTVCGAGVIVTVGGGGAVTVTVADSRRLPPLPAQVSENVLVLVRAPVDSEPLAALTPDQAPEATQPSTLADDQVSVALAPLGTDCGVAKSVPVGAATAWPTPGWGRAPTVVLPQPVADSTSAARHARSQALRWASSDVTQPFIASTLREGCTEITR
jgi:hypothetical protein